MTQNRKRNVKCDIRQKRHAVVKLSMHTYDNFYLNDFI